MNACSCASTEASMRTCRVHGEDQWNTGCTVECSEFCDAATAADEHYKGACAAEVESGAQGGGDRG